MRTFAAVLLFAALMLVLSACQQAPKTSFAASLNGQSEVPAVATDGTGTATLTLDGNAFTLSGSYQNLSGPATMSHIHGPASESDTAGVVVALSAADGELSGSGTFTDAQLEELRAGLYYVNVHTDANPAGEIRGQLK